jgi:hypothetical protein
MTVCLVVTSPHRQGNYALRATVKDGDDPINASGNRNELAYFETGGLLQGSRFHGIGWLDSPHA